ncbi:MAG: hypothetical protein EOL97_16780 [Spirochaetia bacterium]|nr:hypothetical protein [Spirochaetia bacterium]
MKIMYKNELIGEIKDDNISYVNQEKGKVLNDYFEKRGTLTRERLNDEDDLMVIRKRKMTMEEKKAVLLELGFELQ